MMVHAASYFRIGLFPVVILIALLALGLRVTDIYQGIENLENTALAQDAEGGDDENDPENTENNETSSEEQTDDSEQLAGEPATTSPDASFILSLPSDGEQELLTQLRSRREALDRRERQLELQEQTLQGVEKRIDDKIEALQALEVQIRDHLRIYEEQEQAQLDAIVQVYQQMKPKDAAPRFEQLDLTIQVDLATRMAGRKFAAILSQMTENAATRLTTELATRAQPPSLEDVQGGR